MVFIFQEVRTEFHAIVHHYQNEKNKLVKIYVFK